MRSLRGGQTGHRYRREVRLGSAMLMVVSIAVILMMAVLAVGSLALANYHMASQRLGRVQAWLLAEGAVQDFMYRYDRASGEARQGALDLESRRVDDLHLGRLYPNQDGLPHLPSSLGDTHVYVTFDPRLPCWSTDNSCGEYSAAAWRDRGTAARSVPPFCVDLVMQVSLAGNEHRFEAMVARRWPYSAFCARGSMVVTGSPLTRAAEADISATAPSRIEGSLATMAEASAFSPESEHKYDVEVFRDVYEITSTSRSIEQVLLAAGRAEDGRVYVRSTSAINIGSPFVYFTPGGPAAPGRASRGNEVTGNACVSGTLDADQPEAVTVWEGSTLSGHKRAGVFPESLAPDRQPVDSIHLPAADGADLNIVHLPLVRDFPRRPGGGLLPSDRPFISREGFTVLDKDLVIDPDAPCTARVRVLPVEELRPPPTDAPATASTPAPALPRGDTPPPTPPGETGTQGSGTRCVVAPAKDGTTYLVSGGRGNRYVLHGSLGNRRVASVQWNWAGESRARINTSPPSRARLVLRNCTFLVHGSLDLTGDPDNGIESGLEGTNATLIVDGTLVLGGGRLSARDQGMVLYARNIVMRARGEYKGMIVARESLLVLTPSMRDDTDNRLQIRGAVLSGGGGYQDLVIRSTHLVYDPTYLKALHAFGEATTVDLRALP